MKYVKQIIAGIIILAVGFFLGQSWQTPATVVAPVQEQPAKADQKILVSFEYAQDDLSFYPLNWEEGLNILAATQELTTEHDLKFETQDYGELGTLITTIGPKTNGTDNSYWQFWVNGEQPQVGASQYILQPGDILEWRFAESTF